jgi:Domain of unknown function (DUF6265)
MRITVLVLMLVAGGLARGEAAAGVNEITCLTGCWESQSGDRIVEEQWTAPRAGSMLGVGRTVKGNALVEYEFVAIRERDNRLVYIAHPSGQPSAEFTSSSISADSVVFENPQHDFPQRIGYQRTRDGLDAWIDGTHDGRTQRVEFHYRRGVCEPK